MGWRENRRRHRTWYDHYRTLANQLNTLINSGRPIAAEAIIKMFFDLYELRRLHRNNRLANSAFESMVLACRDAGLDGIALGAQRYQPTAMRPPSFGEFGAAARDGVRPGELDRIVGFVGSGMVMPADIGVDFSADANDTTRVRLRDAQEPGVEPTPIRPAEEDNRLWRRRGNGWEFSGNGGINWVSGYSPV